jgi:hypothetical protein
LNERGKEPARRDLRSHVDHPEPGVLRTYVGTKTKAWSDEMIARWNFRRAGNASAEMFSLKTAIGWAKASAFLIGALLCFVLTVSLALINHVAAATLMAGLFVVLVLFNYLPEMEYFKAYGVEAKMRQKLNEAEAIIKKLKAAAIVSGKLGYLVLHPWLFAISPPQRSKGPDPTRYPLEYQLDGWIHKLQITTAYPVWFDAHGRERHPGSGPFPSDG